MDLRSIIAEKDARIAQLEQSLQLALIEIEQLKTRLALDSSTSSKPPSSDTYKKEKVQTALPRGKGKERGGQKGHRGDTLKFSDQIDVEVIHTPQDQHCDCGALLADQPVVVGSQRRPVFDLPPRLVQVSEHRIASIQCSCGRQHHGAFPEQVSAPVQYGSGVHALVQLLNVEMNVAVAKVCDLFSTLGFEQFNENTVVTSLSRASVLKALSEHQKRSWSTSMHDLLMEAYHASDHGKGVFVAELMRDMHQRYLDIIQQGRREAPPEMAGTKGKTKRSKGRNLLNRLFEFCNEIWSFAEILSVPFTNNLAERDIRPLKTKLKVAGSFRAKTGIDHYLILRSLCSTLRKQKRNVFGVLRNLWERKEVCVVLA